jgi:hypothetical protein
MRWARHSQAEGLIHSSPGQRPGFIVRSLFCRPTACFIAGTGTGSLAGAGRREMNSVFSAKGVLGRRTQDVVLGWYE